MNKFGNEKSAGPEAPRDSEAGSGHVSSANLVEVKWTARNKPSRIAPNRAEMTEAQAASWPSRPPPGKALKPRFRNPDLQAQSGGGLVVMVSVLGCDESGIHAALKIVIKQLRLGQRMIPLFLTDHPNQSILRRAGFFSEYFPRSIYFSNTTPELLQQRFADLWRKWSPDYLLDLGKPGLLRGSLEKIDFYLQPQSARKAEFSPRRARPENPRRAVADVAALKADYSASGLADVADTFVLYRILGNDLPPRHGDGQTLANLAFILENEPKLPNCEKRWVVNRIADPDQEAATIALLERHNQPYLHLPFVLEDYAAQEWSFEGFPQLTFFLNGKFADMSPYDQLRAEAHARRHKNQYVMNNNGARNAALEDGRERAKWVLPWDGNCFLTRQAWAELVKTVKSAPYFKYFTVPMSRIADNRELLEKDFSPTGGEEPQILFRRDARETFDEAFVYGRRPKVELFWRLGINGPWDGWHDDVWDNPRPKLAEDAGSVHSAGWVARLGSGRSDLEKSVPTALTGRGLARGHGIVELIDSIDRRALSANFDRERLTAYDEDQLQTLSTAPDGTGKATLYLRLLQEADLALQRGPFSVMEKTIIPPSGDKHDYYHPAPYWWPRLNSPTGLPEIRRDGLRAPGTILYEAESARYDRTSLQRLFDDTTVLALAGSSSGHEAYLEHAADLVRAWFLNPDTRMNPNLEFAQVKLQDGRAVGQPTGLIEMKDLYFFLDAVRLLERSETFTAADHAAFSAWMREYLVWLQDTPKAQAERSQKNNHGTCYDLQIASIAAYLGDVDVLAGTFRRARERIAGQFSKNGEQKHELTRTQTEHYCAFNLQCWVHLATLAETCGDSLWAYTTRDGRNLAVAFKWLLDHYLKGDWPYEQIEPFDRDRYLPIVLAAQARFGSRKTAGAAFGYIRKPLFYPHDGIAPFWALSASLRISDNTTVKAVTATVDKAVARARKALVPGHRKRPSPQELERRLWGGHSEPALEALDDRKQDERAAASDRAFAAWALARWHFFRGHLEQALEDIRVARSFEKTLSPRTLLTETSCLIGLGETAAARHLLHEALVQLPDESNLLLQIANTHAANDMSGDDVDAAKQLEWINRIFALQGLATISKRDPKSPLSICNIEGNETPPVEDGPLISVLMPAFNAAETIAAAIASLQAQSWRNLQIIVADDCSTDATAEIVSNLAAEDPRIRMVQLPANLGAYVARNTALEQAEGEFITAHDADDWSHPQKIEIQMERLAASPDAKGVLSSGIRMRPDLYALGNWRPEARLIDTNPSSLLFERSLLDDMGQWDPVRVDADHEFLSRIRTKFGNDALIEANQDVPLSFSLVRPGALTRQSATHERTILHGARRDYHRNYRRWQRSFEEPQDVSLPSADPVKRSFPAPSPILPRAEIARPFATIFIGDFNEKALNVDRYSGPVAEACTGTGRIGIFHWPDYDSEPDTAFHPDIAELLDSFRLEQISAFQPAKAHQAVLCDPMLATHVIEGLPRIEVPKMDVWCLESAGRKVALDPRRRPMPTRPALEALFGVPCQWVHLERKFASAPGSQAEASRPLR